VSESRYNFRGKCRRLLGVVSTTGLGQRVVPDDSDGNVPQVKCLRSFISRATAIVLARAYEFVAHGGLIRRYRRNDTPARTQTFFSSCADSAASWPLVIAVAKRPHLSWQFARRSTTAKVWSFEEGRCRVMFIRCHAQTTRAHAGKPVNSSKRPFISGPHRSINFRSLIIQWGQA